MVKDVLVIGGGVAGMQATLDLANGGMKVYLVERKPSIGGRMAQLNRTYPDMECGLCSIHPMMTECYDHRNVEVLSYSEVVSVSGKAGDFYVVVNRKARFVDEEKCIGCEDCMVKCPTRNIPDEHNMGLSMRRAIHLPFRQAVPRITFIDKERCIKLLRGKCGICQKKCKKGAIDYNMKDKKVELNVGAIIVATGFDPWDANAAKEFGFGRYPNVFTSIEYERMLNASGPTNGHVVRRSDDEAPKSIAWIQCVGSRTFKHNPYCSSICCMSATKEAIWARGHSNASTTIFYRDLRGCVRGFSEFVDRAKQEFGVEYIHSNAIVEEDPETRNPIVVHQVDGKTIRREFDMVVLSSALKPSKGTRELAGILGVGVNEWDFLTSPTPSIDPVITDKAGIFVAGFATEPKDIPDSVAQGSAAAAHAFEVLSGVE